MRREHTISHDQPLRRFFTDMKAGKEFYRVVAAFDQFEDKEEAPLFRKLAENFELCVFGLNLFQAGFGKTSAADHHGLQKHRRCAPVGGAI